MYIDTIPTYRVTVPHKGRKTIHELLLAGNYGSWIPDLSDEHFPQHRTSDAEVVLELVVFSSECMISNTDAQSEIEKRGLRSAKIEELLAFGTAYPDEQRKYPIIALGSVSSIHGYPCIPFLAADRTVRFVGILAWDDEWSRAMRFLAVHE